jgi:hypothetical protein
MGHPDGQNYAIWRGPDFNAQATFMLSAATPFNAQGLITNFASLCINFAANVPLGGRVVVQWFTDATLAIPLGSMVWRVANGQSLNVIVPAVGNFVTVAITTTNVGAVGCPISVYPTNTSVGVTSYWSVGNFVQNPNVSIPASSVLKFQLPYVAEGSGYCMGIDPNATGHLQLKINFADETFTFLGVIGQINTLAGPVAIQFIANPNPIYVSIQNTDGAAAHACTFYCGVDGRI